MKFGDTVYVARRYRDGSDIRRGVVIQYEEGAHAALVTYEDGYSESPDVHQIFSTDENAWTYLSDLYAAEEQEARRRSVYCQMRAAGIDPDRRRDVQEDQP